MSRGSFVSGNHTHEVIDGELYVQLLAYLSCRNSFANGGKRGAIIEGCCAVLLRDPKLPPEGVEIHCHWLVLHLSIELFQHGNADCFISDFERVLQLPIFG